MKNWLLKMWRIFHWWFRCLWEGKKIKPTREDVLYSRSYLRKAWKPYLQAVDREFNRKRDPQLLMGRRILVARRRREFLPDTY